MRFLKFDGAGEGSRGWWWRTMRTGVLPTPRRPRGQSVPIGETHAEVIPKSPAICEDSRKVKPGDLFIARTGTKKRRCEIISDRHCPRRCRHHLRDTQPRDYIPWADGFHRIRPRRNANRAAAIPRPRTRRQPHRPHEMSDHRTKGKTRYAYLMRAVLKEAGLRWG